MPLWFLFLSSGVYCIVLAEPGPRRGAIRHGRPRRRRPQAYGSTGNMSAMRRTQGRKESFTSARRTRLVHGFHSEGGCGAGEEGFPACDYAERASSSISHCHVSTKAPSHTGPGSCFRRRRFWGPSVNLAGLEEGCCWAPGNTGSRSLYPATRGFETEINLLPKQKNYD